MQRSLGHLHFLTAGRNLSVQELACNVLASVRLRLAPGVRAAGQLGFSVSAGDFIPPNASHIFVGKIVKVDYENRRKSWTNQIIEKKTAGCFVALDYTDHHLKAESLLSSFYKSVMGYADAIVVPNQYLAQSLRSESQVRAPIHVIEDPVECGVKPPIHLRGLHKHRRALWFGHDSNLPFLLSYLAVWPEEAPAQLDIVTSKEALGLIANSKVSSPRVIDVTFHEWTIHKVEELAQESPICIIPSDTQTHKSFASANRLVTSLVLGLPTVATAIPSYEEFAPYFYRLGSDEERDAFKNPEGLLDQITEFQRKFAKRFSMETATANWAALFTKLQF